MSDLPTLRSGTVATGSISTHLVRNVTLERSEGQAKHVIQAIGSSSVGTGKAFAAKLLLGTLVTIYGSYDGCYDDTAVDITYVGTPHAFHMQNCLDAIRTGKHVLCEKPLTINAKEAAQVLGAAKAIGVDAVEGVWTRHFPFAKALHKAAHEQCMIGSVSPVFCDFAFDMNLQPLGSGSRLKNPASGAGSLLDIGIYSIMWALIGLLTTFPRAFIKA